MTWAFPALGTQWQIDGEVSASQRRSVLELLDAFDRTWSRFRPDSAVAELARAGGSIALDRETERLFELYDVLARLTDGALSPLVGDSLVALGYDAGYSLVGAAPRPAPPLSALLREPGRITLGEPALIDIGAAGKGLAVDLVAALLEVVFDGGPDGEPSRLRSVDASGDLWHGDAGRALRVALEHPDDAELAIGVVELAPRSAICASAVNRRAWGTDLHHVLDARTGTPAREVIATWAITDSAMVADGAATALFFADPHDVVAALGLTAAICLTDDRRPVVAGDLPGEIF